MLEGGGGGGGGFVVLANPLYSPRKVSDVCYRIKEQR